jgi:hypothetical protein
MTSRMQITLDPAIRAKVRRRAESFGLPIAEYVRRIIAADLGDEPPRAHVSELFGLGEPAEPTHAARDKNAMIAEAIAAGKLRS